MASPQTRRPWYLVVALALTALSGVFQTASGCTAVSYLRGSSSALPEPSGEIHPVLRLALVRERAWLEGLGHHHQAGFPLSAAKALLGLVLFAASIGALAGRRAARRLLPQALGACAAFAALELGVLGSVRAETCRLVGSEIASQVGPPGDTPSEEAVARYTDLANAIEWGRFGFFEIVVLGGAALAITRARSRAFFDARARMTGTAED